MPISVKIKQLIRFFFFFYQKMHCINWYLGNCIKRGEKSLCVLTGGVKNKIISESGPPLKMHLSVKNELSVRSLAGMCNNSKRASRGWKLIWNKEKQRKVICFYGV